MRVAVTSVDLINTFVKYERVKGTLVIDGEDKKTEGSRGEEEIYYISFETLVRFFLNDCKYQIFNEIYLERPFRYDSFLDLLNIK